MIAGVGGRLVSASFLRDLFPALAREVPPPPDLARTLERWRERSDAVLGPASGPRAVADTAVVPLLSLLELSVAARTDSPDGTVILTRWNGHPGPPVFAAGWGGPLTLFWRQAIRETPSGVRWALCCNGVALRVVDVQRSWSRDYLEFDLSLLAEDDDALAALWSLLRGESLCGTPGTLAEACTLSDRYGVDVCRTLGRGVLDGLACLLERLHTHTPAKARASAQAAAADLVCSPGTFDQALTVIYRVLFLLFAEARGLVPTWHPVYRDRYSVETIVRLLLEGRHPRGLWASVQAICRLAGSGCTAGELRVNAFNGQLFSAAASAAFERVVIDDRAMSRVITALGAVGTRDGGQRSILYRDLDVEQLGAVYERVLDYAPAAPGPPPTPKPYASPAPAVPPRTTAGSESATTGTSASLLRAGDARKSSGSFYTPREVTAALVRKTLDPLLENRSAQEILQLRILDPAMGSGAFLVAVCRYLAVRVEDALIREGRWHPGDVTASDRIAVRRDVASRCLYGVDLNPTAVQLGRLSLWLATLEADKPLSFLDHRLVAGDSLVGATPDDVQRQAPGRQPRSLRPATLPLFGAIEVSTAMAAAARIRDGIAQAPDDSAAAVREKARTLAGLAAPDTPLARWGQLLDLWCSIWFWDDGPPPDRALFAELSSLILHGRGTLPESATAPLLAHAATLAAGGRFLHWPLTFPEVFAETGDGNPGFDAIIGNPPWDMVRGDSGTDTVRDTRRTDARRLAAFVREAGIYRLEARAHVNRYQLFIERALQLVRRGGRIGLVLPSGIATDTGAAPLRRYLFDRADVDSITGLDNRHAIFPIHRSVRFALVTCTTGRPTTATDCRFGISSLDDLERPAPPIVMTRPLLERLSGPDDLGIPECTQPADLRIVEAIGARHPWLSDPCGWGAGFGRELNATDDRDLFTAAARHPHGRPVIEGKGLEPFHVARDRSRYVLREGAALPASARRARLAYRDVASATNRMTLIAAIVPANAVTTHTLFCLKTPLPPDEQQVLCALLNSFVANFLIRLRVNTHVTVSLVSRLPVPSVRRGHPAFSRLLELARALFAGAPPAEAREEYPEMQGLVGRLYGLREEEFERVLETFPLIEPHVRREALMRFTAFGPTLYDTEAPRHRGCS